jgi:aminoglycoside/choline kinase family phosphotransferase
VTLIDAAVGEKDGQANFQEHVSSSQGRITSEGTSQVQVVSLDNLVAKQGVQVPAVIKMDIEGGEFEALLGATGLIVEHHPVILLATHGSDIHLKCVDLLRSLNYNLLPINQTLESTSELIAYQGELPPIQ